MDPFWKTCCSSHTTQYSFNVGILCIFHDLDKESIFQSGDVLAVTTDQRRGPCWGREAHVLGTQETCLGAGRVAKHLHFGVLHGAGDGTVHEASNSKVWYTQFAFQHGVLYDRETGRLGDG